MKAIWNGHTIAESNDTVVVEGNHYFPRESLVDQYFQNSSATSFCPWKGQASYFDIQVDGQNNPGAAWTYTDPKSAAAEIKNRVAFWKGVEITD